ncbi:MAG: toprim domain-containing protein [Patescibacteria group bacterium]
MKLPEVIKKLSGSLSELPSIGPRQAIRLAFYLAARGAESNKNLAESIRELGNAKICERCFFIHQNRENLCDICKDASRKQSAIMVVEKETDLISLEDTGRFNGRYLILGAIPKTGLLEGWQKLRLQNLKSFIEKELGGKAEEVILAFNPTSYGDFHASIITKEIGSLAKKVSRLGIGIPTGGEIEFADSDTLGNALQKRS